jgi:hypothetical protein
VLKAFAAIDGKQSLALEREILTLIGEFNIAKDGTSVIPSDYLEAVVTKTR